MMSITKSSKIQILLIIVLSLSIIGIAAQFAPGMFTRYIFDDFCEANAVSANTFGRYAIKEYLQWTGRYSGIILRGLATAGGLGFLSFLPYLFLVSTILASYWCFLPLMQHLNLPKPKLIALTIAAFFLCTLYSILPSLFESVFWKSSSTIYSAPLLLFFLQVGLLLRAFFSGRSKWLPCFIFLTFIASGFSEIYNLLQLALLAVTIITFMLRKMTSAHKVFARYLLAGLVTAFLGTLIQLLSPGNAVRQAASHLPSGIPLLELPYQLLRATAIEFYVFLIYGRAWLIPISLFPFAIGTFRSLKHRDNFYSDKTSKRSQQVWSFLFYLAAALMVIALAAAAPSAYYQADAPVSRAMIVIFPIFLVALIIGMYILGWHFSDKVNKRPVAKKLILAMAVLILVSQVGIEVYQAAQVLPAQMEYARAWDARDEELRSLAAQGIKETETQILTNAYAYSDLSEDPKNWVNRCFAEYYGFESITGIPSAD